MSGTSRAWHSFAYVGVMGRVFPDHIWGCPGGYASLLLAGASWEVFRNIFAATRGTSAMLDGLLGKEFKELTVECIGGKEKKKGG